MAEEAKRKTAKRKAVKKHVVEAVAHVYTSFNNTIITITNGGDVLATSSAGAKFKGSRKSTPFAGGEAVKLIADKIKAYGVRRIKVRVNGPGGGRESAVRELHNQGFHITDMEDVTPLPHNGCRARKERRA